MKKFSLLNKIAFSAVGLFALTGVVMVGTSAFKGDKAVIVYADGHTHNSVTFTEWTNADSLPDSGNYYLTKDVTISSTWKPAGGTRLCLNGHGIKKEGTGNVIEVRKASSLYLYDCDHTTEHKYTIDESGLAVVDDSLTTDYQTFTGGYITGGNGVSTGGGIYLPGGTKNGNTTSLYMYGGTIIGNTTTGNGGGISYSWTSHMNSTISLTDVSIIGNTAPNGVAGGIFHQANNRTMTLGGNIVIKDNVAKSTIAGIYENATLNVSGNIYISGNRLTDGSAADVFVKHDSQPDIFNITGAINPDSRIGIHTLDRNAIYGFYTHNDVTIDPNSIFISNNNRLFRKSDNNVVFNAVTSTAYSGDYDGNPHSISLALEDDTLDHTIKYGLTEGKYDLDANPEFTLPGEYTIYYQVTMGLNVHNGSNKVTINALPVEYTAPTEITGLHYTGEEQALVNAGTATHGTMLYKVDEGEWGSDLPSATDVGTYTVSYKVVGDTGYENIDPASFEVTISANDKSALADKIVEAKAYYDSIKDTYPAIAQTLDGVIKAAEEVRDEDNETVQEIADAVASLANAMTNDEQLITAVNEVVEKINAIGEVTLEKEVAIVAARTAYTALEDDAKPDVTNYQTLLDAEAALQHIKDQMAADAVIAKINNIGTVSYPDSKTAIDDARDAYDALTDDQKELVTNYQTLLDAEATYADYDAANTVKNLINAIGDVEYTEECKGKIDAARTAYDALTDTQKELVTNYQTLLDAEELYAKLKADHDAADAVKALINAIGKVELNDTCKGKIDAAKAAYDALTDDQKELVTNKKVLFDDIELYATLAHQPTVVDNGVKVEGKDGELIPVNVTVKVEVKTNVKAQQGTVEYENIQKLLGGNQKISGVYDVKLMRTVGDVVTEIQPSDIKSGMIIIVEITLPDGLEIEGLKVLHIHSEDDISYVENFKIDAGKLTFETDRLSEIAFVVPAPSTGLPVWALVLIIVGGLLLLCCLFFLVMFIFFPRYIIDYKNKKVIRTIYVKKHYDMVLLLDTHLRKVRRNEADVYKNKADAEANLK